MGAHRHRVRERIVRVGDPRCPTALPRCKNPHGARRICEDTLEVVIGEGPAQECRHLVHDGIEGAHVDGVLQSGDDRSALTVLVATADEGGVAVEPLEEQVESPEGSGKCEVGAGGPQVGDRVDALSLNEGAEALDHLGPEFVIGDAHERPRAGVCDNMQASDLMFMPSEQETFGLALIEGAACGMPVIVRDIHDYDATFGDLVIRSDEDHFAATINRYLTDKQLYADGVKRSHRIASRYDTTKTEHQLLDLYRSLLSDDSEAAGV